MPKPKTQTTKWRLYDKIVVRLTPEEYNEIFNPGKNGEHKVRRRMCTFLPGVLEEGDPRLETHQVVEPTTL